MALRLGRTDGAVSVGLRHASSLGRIGARDRKRLRCVWECPFPDTSCSQAIKHHGRSWPGRGRITRDVSTAAGEVRRRTIALSAEFAVRSGGREALADDGGERTGVLAVDVSGGVEALGQRLGAQQRVATEAQGAQQRQFGVDEAQRAADFDAGRVDGERFLDERDLLCEPSISVLRSRPLIISLALPNNGRLTASLPL